MIKKLLLPTLLILFSTILVACGDNDEVTDPPQSDTTTDTEQEQVSPEEQDNATQDDQTDPATNGTNDDNVTDFTSNYNFTSFNLEADIDNDDDAVDVDFEVEHDEVEASYENRQQGLDLSGNEAMDELDSIFSAFRFDENTPDGEVLNEVLEAFNIPEDAHVELEVEFTDGVEKEYNQ